MIRELITDADILAGRVASPIVLGPGICLTPAARDRAMTRGLRIVEADEAAAASSARPAPNTMPPRAPGQVCAGYGAASCSGGCGAGGSRAAAACTRCGNGACAGGCSAGADLPAPAGAHGATRPDRLADGLYLVRVQGGRTVSVQPASGAGHMPRSRAP